MSGSLELAVLNKYANVVKYGKISRLKETNMNKVLTHELGLSFAIKYIFGMMDKKKICKVYKLDNSFRVNFLILSIVLWLHNRILCFLGNSQ